MFKCCLNKIPVELCACQTNVNILNNQIGHNQDYEIAQRETKAAGVELKNLLLFTFKCLQW